ncbi:hypothetical protein M0R72_13980 [Candidatus Pacearchaeota archaeon]|jgi:hypothetical protein|nr:hypothetical protein [Candidatus Pacearchaeota archaeon]
MTDMLLIIMFLFVLFIAIFIAIARWIFRVNHIVDRLDKIVALLSGDHTEKPKSFVDGLKKGMSD